MTIKEITALRKSGHLDEARAAAEVEFAKSANQYTAGALFWCLNDFCKLQIGDEADDTIEYMRILYNDFCSGDEYMQKALESAKSRNLPHFQEIKEAVENAKGGADAISSHKKATIWYAEGQLDSRLYPDFGWLIYYALKQTPYGDSQKRKVLLNQYFQLDLPKPSILHSLILVEAIKIEQNTPLQFRIRDFIRIWGLENLRDEDWEQYRTEEGNTLPSTVEKLIGVYTKEIKSDGVEAPNDFSLLVDKALAKYTKNQNMPYFKATILVSQGKTKEALTYYKNMLLQFPSKYYLWDQTAELVEDVDTKIGLLCKALTCGADDEFLGGVRLRLASLLCQVEKNENAKYEIEKYKETYQSKGWNLKPYFWQVYNTLSSVPIATDNENIYLEYIVKADEFIYSSLPTVVAVKVAETYNEDRNRPGCMITTWILRTQNSTMRLRKPTKFRLNRSTPNGVAFDVKLKDDKIVWITQHTDTLSEPWLKEVNGEVQLRVDKNGRNYAIISGSYVSGNLLRGINDGQIIKLLSIQQKDGRWSAISIINS